MLLKNNRACSLVTQKENQIKKLTDKKRETQEKYTREVRKKNGEIYEKEQEIKKIQGIQHFKRSYNCINTWHFMYNIQCTGTKG